MKSHKNPVKPHKITMNIQSRSRQCQEKNQFLLVKKHLRDSGPCLNNHQFTTDSRDWNQHAAAAGSQQRSELDGTDMVISPTKMVVFHTDLIGCLNASLHGI